MKTNLLPEWDNQNFKKAQKDILKHLKDRKHKISTSGEKSVFVPKRWEDVENTLGLAYTSSSMCAGYWVCNVTLWASDGKEITGFAITDAGQTVALVSDMGNKDEIINL